MNAVRAEWTKLFTTPGPAWLLLATATVIVALGAAVATIDARLFLGGVYVGQVPVTVLAVLTVSGEYSTALIRTTLTAVPRRPTALAAKAVVLAVAVAASGSLAMLASLLIAETHVDGPLLRATAGTVAYLILIAILSLGIAAAVRDSGAAIGTVLGLLYLPPVLTSTVADPHWHRLLEQIAPMSAGLSIQATTGVREMPLGPWAGLGVLAAWSGGAFLAGTLLLRSRDT